MCEILFRGKREDSGEWVYGDLLQDKDLDVYMIEYFDYYSSDTGLERGYHQHVIIHETIGQYTGLTDKNGKKIFEGDICTYPDGYVDYAGDGVETLSIGVVTWDSKQPSFYITENIGVEWEEIWDSLDEITVIGNIHDNPDLLKESEGGENG